MIIKKRNHYIPKTYLKKFLNKEKKLFVYKKGKDSFQEGMVKADRLLTIEGIDGLNRIAVKNKLYIPEGDAVEDKNIFEDFFNQEVESKYDDFINFVENNFSNTTAIFDKYKDYIIILIASMLSRTLHSKIEMEEMYKVSFQAHNWAQSSNKNMIPEMKAHLIKEFPTITEDKLDKVVKDYLEMVEEGKFGVTLPRNLFIKHIFQNLEMYGQLISGMTIQILQCKDPCYFITTDAPVVYFVPEEKVSFPYGHKSLGSPYTELFFPLTKNLCLLLSHKKMEVLSGIIVNKEMVDIINYNLSNNSRDYIFSPEKADFLEEFIENYIPYPFELKMK